MSRQDSDFDADSPAAAQLNKALDEITGNTLVQALQGLDTLLVYTKNLIMFPEEKKYRRIKVTNIHYLERLGRLKGATAAMNAIGYHESDGYLRLDAEKNRLKETLELLQYCEQQIQALQEDARKRFASLPHRLDLSKHTFTSVQGAGAHGDIGRRQTMEDDEIMVDGFCDDVNQGYFGLYDGHGGRQTVDFVVKVLHMNLQSELENKSQTMEQCYTNAYLLTDGQLRRQNILKSGSTAVSCLVRRENGVKTLYTANVGDSRAVLIRGTTAIRLTIDHKASIPEEAERIKAAGGFVGKNKRVNGVLAISRALGDHMLKENDIVSARPYCVETKLTDEDDFLILACDGVWDVMTDQEVADFVLDRMSRVERTQNSSSITGLQLNSVLADTAKGLVDAAIAARTTDNVTAMIIKL